MFPVFIIVFSELCLAVFACIGFYREYAIFPCFYWVWVFCFAVWTFSHFISSFFQLMVQFCYILFVLNSRVLGLRLFLFRLGIALLRLLRFEILVLGFLGFGLL